MQKCEGVGILSLPWGKREIETFTCSHGNHVRAVTTRNLRGDEVTNVYWCDVCDGKVCGPCVNEKRDHRCVVWEEKMAIMEAKGRFIKDVFRCS